MDHDVKQAYGNRVRARACGLCWDNDRLLMVNHSGLTPTGNFWAPPGGGIEFGQPVGETLIREFVEETGLHVHPGQFMFSCEHILKPIHSIELFFAVSVASGSLRRGHDPEVQIIKDVRFFSASEIDNIPRQELHGIFRMIDSAAALKTLGGFFTL